MQSRKRVVIVGGNSGVGQAVRQQLEATHDVICMSRRQPPAVDVTDEEPAFPPLDGPIEGLVYCPGTINLKPIRSLSVDDYRQDFEVNLVGAVKALKHCLPNLRDAEDASVVLFSTVAVQTGMTFHTSVASAKGAVEGFVRAAAAELAPAIRVNAIALSLTETPLAQGLLRSDKQREALRTRHPLKRLGRPEDAAALVRLLLSDEGSWITGQILHLDGGLSALRGG
jgi:NAD(P)-dependent dehydrogenase (short-subunit alcohol dehydrogenase family)